VLRYLVSSWVQYRSGSIIFPFGTLAVNMIGCLVIGLLSFLVESRSMFSPETRAFVLIGLLGAFTTFSTFGNETLALIRDNRLDLALVNAGVQVFFGVGMVWLGRVLAALIWR
jgi:CrcB protein